MGSGWSLTRELSDAAPAGAIFSCRHRPRFHTIRPRARSTSLALQRYLLGIPPVLLGQSFGRPPESPVYPASRWGKHFGHKVPVISSLSPVGVLGVVFCILASLRVCWSHVAVSWWSWDRAYSKDPEKISLAFQV